MLFRTKKVWHEYDTDGGGVSASQLASIMQHMLEEGAICLNASGKVVLATHARERNLTGLY